AGAALRRAQEHVRTCAPCREEIEALRSLRRLLREHLGAPQPGESGAADLGGMADRVADRARRAPVLSLGGRLRVRGREELDERGRSWAAVAVAMAAALTVVG